MNEETLNLLRLLLARLERISADSYWAHRASGTRGSLLKMAEAIEHGEPVSSTDLENAMRSSFHILEQAANEKFSATP